MGRVVGTEPKLQPHRERSTDMSQNEIIELQGLSSVCVRVCVCDRERGRERDNAVSS